MADPIPNHNPAALAHRFAMDAKALVGNAQNEAAQIPLPGTATGRSASSGLRKTQTFQNALLRDLAKARAALESLDRTYLAWIGIHAASQKGGG